LVTDVRSAIVGSIFGALVGLGTAALASGPTQEIIIPINDEGYNQPMKSLLGELSKSGEATQITFSPVALKDVYVCEFAHLKGDSSREMILSYLDKYSACFTVRQIGEERFVVEPNTRVGLLKAVGPNWTCLCP
jgi:hypothetical protein